MGQEACSLGDGKREKVTAGWRSEQCFALVGYTCQTTTNRPATALRLKVMLFLRQAREFIGYKAERVYEFLCCIKRR